MMNSTISSFNLQSSGRQNRRQMSDLCVIAVEHEGRHLIRPCVTIRTFTLFTFAPSTKIALHQNYAHSFLSRLLSFLSQHFWWNNVMSDFVSNAIVSCLSSEATSSEGVDDGRDQTRRKGRRGDLGPAPKYRHADGTGWRRDKKRHTYVSL